MKTKTIKLLHGTATICGDQKTYNVGGKTWTVTVCASCGEEYTGRHAKKKCANNSDLGIVMAFAFLKRGSFKVAKAAADRVNARKAGAR